MNDFTIEELRHIGDALLHGIYTLPQRKDAILAIRGKVLNMIEDYCENECDHKWDGILISTNPNIGKCKKCNTECFIALLDVKTVGKKNEC